MREGMTKLRCGACGGDTVRVFTDPHEAVLLECVSCSSVTEVSISDPKLEFRWPQDVKSVNSDAAQRHT